LEAETILKLKKACEYAAIRHRIVLCFRGLSFVGSSGISTLFTMVGEIRQRHGDIIRVAGLASEFKRLVQFSPIAGMEFQETVDGAIESLRQSGPHC
ncbi:MAG: STAS domain-containing protein, partial [Bdellovibrionaceae bacterium]|nr:STAS domain-containing protein [Pseudobdellovibrionaceae bacterium]